ncbi:YsnF/AvaK domain-containing protein [Vaginisenegalia massiliensis]|uniref:YsnF/AvaK domain-containing protein n=1 Tax=Vaginisenegalia massiliensis TaxID=2058294 RepID=UPI000F5287E6|nr:YsnF/AvaK domain-containing protein [Vaginisenegalia massiliensis]
MSKKFVYGTYPNVQSAQEAVDVLVKNGIPEQNISLVASPGILDGINSRAEALTLDEITHHNNHDWWDSFLGLFSPADPEYQQQEIDFAAYERDVQEGKVLVAVDRDFEAQTLGLHTNQYQETNRYADENFVHGDQYNHDLTDDHQTIQLHEEQVNARTESEVVGDVEISKEVVTETKTIEVPVEKEVLNVTRRDVHQKADDHAFDGLENETISIPLREDKVKIDRETLVTEEVDIDKSVERSNRVFNEETRKEVLDIDKDETIIARDQEKHPLHSEHEDIVDRIEDDRL